MEEAELAFEEFKDKWGKKHPIIVRSWEQHWLELTTYFAYPYGVRRLIYTTNTILSVGFRYPQDSGKPHDTYAASPNPKDNVNITISYI